MEEKKLDKDINVRSKELTDEEIVKALECCIKYNCKNCPYMINGIDCILCKRAETDFLDLIRRLQYGYSSASKASEEWREKYEKERKENAELQKQMDELLNRRIEPKIFYCHADALEICPKVEQAVKDTAKEILDEVSKHYGGAWLVELYKRYGVEVG